MAQAQSVKATLKRLYQLINLEKKEISSVYVFAIISGIILLSLPLGIQAIINLLFARTLSTSLIILIIVVVFGVLLTGILQVAQMRATERIQQRIFTRLTFAYALRIPKLNLLGVDKYYLPELVNRFFDTASLQKGMSKLLLDIPSASIQVLFGLILLSFYHPVFIAFGVLMITTVVIIFYYTSPKGFTTSMRESDYKYDLAHWLEEVSRSVKTFKFFQSNNLHLKKTDKLVVGYLKSREEHFSILILQYRIIIAFKVVITATMLIIGSILFINQQINLGQFIAADIIILTIINSIEKLIISLEVVYDVLTSLEKINKVIDKPLDTEIGLIGLNDWKDKQGLDINIENLNFGFNPKKPILNNLNLAIPAGQKVCITGTEGSGKSTLIKLLTGMYLDFSGNILINNNPIKSIKPEVFHKNISMYLSEEELFSGTLIDNITVGAKNSNLEELKTICDLVGLTDFINKQQDGLLVNLDPQGKKLPNNISHKILLARCLFINPKLLLLEDGWLGIDPETKNNIINFITSPLCQCTVIAINNDASFAERFNRIIKMENGTII